MKESCPSCDSESGIREIIYGMPEFPVDETKYFVGGCCIPQTPPIWACIDCGWSGWSLNNSFGMKLSEWKCPICESIGKIRILGMTEQSTFLTRNYTFRAEPPKDDRPSNGLCLKCGWAAVFIRCYSY